MNLNQRAFSPVQIIIAAVAVIAVVTFGVLIMSGSDEADEVITDSAQQVRLGSYAIDIPQSWTISEVLDANGLKQTVTFEGEQIEFEYDPPLEAWFATSNPTDTENINDIGIIDNLSLADDINLFDASTNSASAQTIRYIFIVDSEAVEVTSPDFGGEDPTIHQYTAEQASNDTQAFVAALSFENLLSGPTETAEEADPDDTELEFQPESEAPDTDQSEEDATPPPQ